jgi:hypothetical protein
MTFQDFSYAFLSVKVLEMKPHATPWKNLSCSRRLWICRNSGSCGKHWSGLLGRQIQQQSWPDDKGDETDLSIIAQLHRKNMLPCKELSGLRLGYNYRRALFPRVSRSAG